MGPIALFDKSFLQSLSVDESVWFDNFFIANVCPIFHAETLADLKKSTKHGRTPEEEVGVIANKFPEKSGSPNAYHVSICLAELLGQDVPMKGQIVLPGGTIVDTSVGPAAVYENSPEARAFERWGQCEFSQTEYEYARLWREAIPTLDPAAVAEFMRNLGIDMQACRSLDSAKEIATNIVSGRLLLIDPMPFAFSLLKPSDGIRERIINRWRNAHCPPLNTFAPYTAHVLTVQFFFFATLSAKLVSERPSNQIDMAYLFYLPFCQLFISSDGLHRRLAPLFLRTDQEFVWGYDLKESLAQLNNHYLTLPDVTKHGGIMSFAPHPPRNMKTLVVELWDRCWPNWRKRRNRRKATTPEDTLQFINEIESTMKSSVRRLPADTVGSIDPMAVMMERRVRRRKGTWYQVPKDLKA